MGSVPMKNQKKRLEQHRSTIYQQWKKQLQLNPSEIRFNSDQSRLTRIRELKPNNVDNLF